MSEAPTPDPVSHALLVVETDPGVEIEIFDHQFALVARRTDEWQGKLPLGLYKVLFRAGGRSTETLVRLTEEGCTVRGTVEGWRSASPSGEIAGFGSALDASPREANQSETTRKCWKNCVATARREGARSMLFVCVTSPVVASKLNPARSVEAFPFAPGADALAWDHKGHCEGDGWATRVIHDPPEQLRLRSFNGRARVEQTVPIMDGYCTAVFLEYGRVSAKRWGVLGGVTSILASPLDRDPDKAVELHRYADLALRALERGGRPISESAGKQLARDGSVDPLTRLYITAHLFARWSPKWAEAQPWIREMAIGALDELGRTSPQIPDVRLLATWAAGQGWMATPDLPVDYPPMLNFAWTAGIQASIRNPDLIPGHVPAGRAGKRRMGAGPWLAWRARPDIMAESASPTPAAATKKDVLELYEQAFQIVKTADFGQVSRAGGSASEAARMIGMTLFDPSFLKDTRMKFTSAETNLISVLALGSQLDDTLELRVGSEALESAVEQTSVALGQSANTLAETLTGVVAKLG